MKLSFFHNRRFAAVAAGVFLLLATAIVAIAAQYFGEPTVRTDKDDYAPGETAVITGSGFHPFESVTLEVEHLTGGIEGGAGHDPWTVETDAQGSFSSDWYVDPDDSLGAILVLTADCQHDGPEPAHLHAEWTFTDSVTSVNITNPTSSAPVTITSLPATVTIAFSYETSSTGTTTAKAEVLGTSASAEKTVSAGAASDSISVTIPAGTPNGSHNAKVTVFNSTGGGANNGNDVENAAVRINVPSNAAPVANSQAVTTAEDTPASIGLGATDANGDSITYTIVSGPTSGSLDGTGAAQTYTPNPNFYGNDSFTFKVNDGKVDSNIATVTITVNPVNDAPVANNDSYSATEDTPLTVSVGGLLANDTDVEGNTLTTIEVSDPAHGSVSLNDNGTFTYTPAANYHGTDSFTYKANDGTADSSVATVSITVDSVNDAPEANPQTVTTDEDTPKSITLVGSDVDGDSLTFTVVDEPSHGSLSGTGAGLTYTPDANYHGSDSFTFKANDGSADSNIATIDLTVVSVNDNPTAVNDSATLNEDSSVTVDALENDSDDDGDTLTIASVSAASHGVAVIENGKIKYEPASNYYGPDSFSYSVSDGNGGTASATVNLTVASVNDAPSFTKGNDVAVNEDSGAYSAAWASAISAGPENESTQNVTFEVSNDNSALFTAQPAITSGGMLSFTPTVDAFGDATVSVYLKDTGGTELGGDDTSETVTFKITVRPVNDVPSFTKGGDQTVLEDAGAQTVATWATNIIKGPVNEDGQTVNFIVTNDNNSLFSAQPSISANGTLTYTPEADANGTATVKVKIQDNGGTDNGGVDTSTEQEFTITVTEVNDAPSFTKGADVTVNEDSAAYSAAWATDIKKGPANEGSQVLTFEVTATDTTLFASQPEISSTGTLTFTPAANKNGSTTVTVKLKDDGGTTNGGDDTSDDQTFKITVTAVNDVPSFTKGSGQTVTEDAGAQAVDNWATNLSAGPSDESSQELSFLVTNDNNSLFSVQPAVDPTGKLTYTPASDANGTTTVKVKIKDDGGVANGGVDTSAEQEFTITVTEVNDAPTAVTDKTATDEDTALTIPAGTLLGNDSKGPANESGQTLTLKSVAATTDTHGTVTINGSGNVVYTPDANWNGLAKFTYTIEDNGTTNGNLDKLQAIGTVEVTVNPVNDSPIVTILAPATGSLYKVDTEIPFKIRVSDPDIKEGDTLEQKWSFLRSDNTGVNTSWLALATPTDGTTVFDSIFPNSFADAGVYNVTVSVRDASGAIGTTTVVLNDPNSPAFVVVYDPTGGFVTGGGWITSPAGAMPLYPSATGKATFGFVSKYQKGATVPTGDTEFQFKAGDLNFKSKVYEWLVVSGAKAQFKGSGTINGSGDFGFLLSAIDGQLSGGGGTDKFRIKIWNKSTNIVVYDNNIGTADDANPTTVLGGGSIVIHK